MAKFLITFLILKFKENDILINPLLFFLQKETVHNTFTPDSLHIVTFQHFQAKISS